MSHKPILAAIREILKFKDHTTIGEIAKITGKKQADVLKVLNVNGHMVLRYRSNGHITGVNPRIYLQEKLRKEGAFFWVTDYDYGSTKGLAFEKHDELREKLQVETYGGGIGDSYPYKYVPDTPENRAALVKDGCLHASDMVIDDRLWQEDE